MTCDVGSGLSLNIAAGMKNDQLPTAMVLTAIAAALSAAKSTAEHYLSEDERRTAEETRQRNAEAALSDVVARYKSPRAALEAIADGQELNQLLSQEVARELLQIAALDPDSAPAGARLEELIVYVGRWIEDWCKKHGEQLSSFEQRFDDFDRAVRGDLAGIKGQIERSEQKTVEGHLLIRKEVAAGNAAILDQIKAFLPAIDSQIEKAVTHVKNRKYEIAIEMLEEFRARPDLTPVQRFRVLKFLGNAYGSGRGDFHGAARLYLDAKACLPDAEEALGLEAIARLNLGERQLALELADAALVNHPRAPGALLVKVRALPDETPFAEVERVVPEDLRGEADVAAALAYRAWTSDEDEIAERYATRARDAAPEAPSHVAFLGQVIIDAQRKKVVVGPNEEISGFDPAKVSAAAEQLSRAIEMIGRADNPSFLSSLRLYRGLAYKMLGQKQEAGRDYDAAYLETPDHPEVLVQRSLLQRDQGDLSGAIATLRRGVGDGRASKATQLLAHLLASRNAQDDRDEAAKMLLASLPSLPDAEPWLRESTVDTLLRVLGASGQHERAMEVFRGLPADLIDPAILLGFESAVHRRAGNIDEAKRAAREAAAAITPETSKEDVQFVAENLHRLQLHRDAFTLWKATVRPDRLGYAAHAFVEAALRCGEDAELLSFCKALRQNHLFDPECFEVELQTLHQYNALDEAKAAVEQFLAEVADNRLQKRVRAMFSTLAIDMGHPELVEKDPSKLPEVESVDAKLGEAVVHVLCQGDQPIKAVEYAYALVRRFPSDKEAHRAMIRSFMMGMIQRPEIPNPTEVGPGTAVCLKEEGEAPWWIIIEDQNPDVSREEFSSGHELIRPLLGRKVGEEAVLNPTGLQDRRLKIAEIIPKFVRRLHVSMGTWESLAPGDAFMSRISIKSGTEGKPDFSPIFRSVDLRHERFEYVEKVCREHGLPVQSLADALGISTIEAFQHVVVSRGQTVKMCLGSIEERDAAIAVLNAAKGAVLTPSAVAVLYLTGTFRRIKAFPFEVLVSRGTVAEIRKQYEHAVQQSPDGGYIAKVPGGHTYVPTDVGELERRRESLRELVEWLETVPKVVDGLAVLKLPAERRQLITDAMGTPWVEALGIAKERDYLFWEEEFGLATYAANEYGVTRTWGQAVVSFGAERGVITADAWHSHACELFRLNFRFTSIQPRTIVWAGKESAWKPTSGPLKTLIEYICNATVSEESRTALCAALLRAAWTIAPEADAIAVTRAFIKRFKRQPFRALHISALRDCVHLIFPDNSTLACKLWIVLYRWEAFGELD
jgi:tetratricopeptide (TPR) repeat protein